MEERDWQGIEQAATRISEIVDDHDVPGPQPATLAELQHLASKLRQQNIAGDKCAELVTWAGIFFSPRKWRRYRVDVVRNALHGCAWSIKAHIRMLQGDGGRRPPW